MAAKAKKVSNTATKTANSSKIAVKKSVPAKKMANKVKEPAKKVTVSKAVPSKKAAVKKTAVPKTAGPKKAIAKVAAVKKTASKKMEVPTKAAAKKTVLKKVAPPKKVVPAKKVVTKVVTPQKAVPKKVQIPVKAVKTNIVTKEVAKKEVPKKVNIKAAPAVEKVTKITSKQLAATKKTDKKVNQPTPKKPRSKKDDFVAPAPLSAREEIVDAVREKPKKAIVKPGIVIAQRTFKKETEKQEAIKMSQFNPNKRSLLDEPEQKSGVRKRYSDEDLNEFKELILGRLENARKELVYLQGLITRKDEAGTEDTDNRFNHMEDGSGAMEREQLSQLAGRQIQFISHLEKALIRIENKTYGVCRVTGELIDKARLRAVPHATLSIEAKNLQNK